MKYKVVAADDLLEVEAEVNRLIEEGYKCTGGIQVVLISGEDRKGFSTTDAMYYQAMIRE